MAKFFSYFHTQLAISLHDPFKKGIVSESANQRKEFSAKWQQNVLNYTGLVRNKALTLK